MHVFTGIHFKNKLSMQNQLVDGDTFDNDVTDGDIFHCDFVC